MIFFFLVEGFVFSFHSPLLVCYKGFTARTFLLQINPNGKKEKESDSSPRESHDALSSNIFEENCFSIDLSPLCLSNASDLISLYLRNKSSSPLLGMTIVLPFTSHESDLLSGCLMPLAIGDDVVYKIQTEDFCLSLRDSRRDSIDILSRLNPDRCRHIPTSCCRVVHGLWIQQRSLGVDWCEVRFVHGSCNMIHVAARTPLRPLIACPTWQAFFAQHNMPSIYAVTPSIIPKCHISQVAYLVMKFFRVLSAPHLLLIHGKHPEV